MTTTSPRGFALLIAVILTSVVLTLGEALIDIAYKQVILAASAKNSEYAFYAADSALECALYYDQKVNAFYYGESNSIDVTCEGQLVSDYAESQDSQVRTTVFSVPCSGGGTSADVSIYKQPDGTTDIYANGYNTCDASSATRVERGLKIHY